MHRTLSHLFLTAVFASVGGCRAQVPLGGASDGDDGGTSGGDGGSAGSIACDTSAGGPTTLVQGGPFVYGLAADATYLYMATGQGVARAPRQGGTASAMSTTGEADAIVVDATSVYWAGNYTDDAGSKPTSGTGLFSVPVDGTGTVTLLADGAWSQQIAVDAQNVYGATPSPWSVPITGGPKTTLTTSPDGLNSRAIALYGSYVYVASSAPNASIVSLPKLGGAPTVLVPNRVDPISIAVDSTGLYWAEDSYPNQPGGVFHAGLDGSNVVTLSSDPAPSGLVVDADNVYWTSSATGAVQAIPKAGGPIVVIASGLAAPDALVQYGGNVYWASEPQGDAATAPPIEAGSTSPTVLTACK